MKKHLVCSLTTTPSSLTRASQTRSGALLSSLLTSGNIRKSKILNFKFSIISTFFIRSSNFDGFLMRSADVALIDGTQRQKTPSQSKMSIRILIFLKHFSCFFVSVKRFCRWRELRRLSKTLDFEEKCINHAFL